MKTFASLLCLCTLSIAAQTPAPRLTVAVTYSAKAQQTLTQRHETVIVAAMPYGSPRPNTPKRLIDEEGQLNLGMTKREITPGAVAVFNPLPLDTASTKYLNSDGPQLLLNVYSGRKTSPDNLLSCSIYQGALSQVEGTTIPIHCKLIAEEPTS